MIRDNVLGVRKRIAAACLKAKRDPAAVKLICVTKNRGVEEIREALLGGVTEFGENRVQEVRNKYAAVSGERLAVGAHRTPLAEYHSSIQLHMLGHLQTNKAKEAVKIFDLIQSVDSLRLAEEIDKQAAKINKIQDVLIEVKTSPEATKFGLMPDEVFDFLKAAQQLKNIAIKGLMTIAPVVDNPENARPYFRRLRELKDRINELRAMSYELRSLSMGMTDDFEVAIEEGSDMVRIGRAVFEGKI